MERLPKRECYVFSQPNRIFDLIGWDRETKKYRLRDDAGNTLDIFHNEFVPVSLAHEDLVVASETGEIVPATEALERGLTIAQPEAPGGPPSHAEPRTRAKGRASRTNPESANETRAKVREMLLPCKTREEIAGVASGILGVSAEELVAKYAHLDNGRFRMTLGNRMVGTLK